MKLLNEITSKVEGVFNDYMDFFKGQESTSKVLVSYSCRIPNVSGTAYLEILLKEDMLNEKGIDLLTVEINYDVKDGATDVRGEFFGSDRVIMKDFHYHAATADIDGIKKSLVSFMEEIKNGYDDILYKKFINPKFLKTSMRWGCAIRPMKIVMKNCFINMLERLPKPNSPKNVITIFIPLKTN